MPKKEYNAEWAKRTIYELTTPEIPKKDKEGNPLFDESGNPVLMPNSKYSIKNVEFYALLNTKEAELGTEGFVKWNCEQHNAEIPTRKEIDAREALRRVKTEKQGFSFGEKDTETRVSRALKAKEETQKTNYLQNRTAQGVSETTALEEYTKLTALWTATVTDTSDTDTDETDE